MTYKSINSIASVNWHYTCNINSNCCWFPSNIFEDE